MSIIINLNDVEMVKQFVDDMRQLPCDIDVIRGHYVIDAKSIMGIFSLSLDQPVTVKIHSEDEEIIKKFESLCTKYCA